MPWTNDQEMSIKTIGCDLLLSAAAGSGKTAVLTQRIIKRVTDTQNPVDIDRFLIMTFTNAAAAEMKERITKELLKCIKKDPQNIHLKKQISLLLKSDITTIHSFCLNIVRKYGHLIDLDPNMTVADTAQVEALKLAACEDMLEQMYSGENASEVSDLCYVLARGIDSEFFKVLIYVYNYIMNFEDPIGYLENCVSQYRQIDDIDNCVWIEWIKDELRGIVLDVKTCYNKLQENALAHGFGPYAETATSDLQVVSDFLACLSGQWESIYNFAFSASFEKSKQVKGASDQAAKDMIKGERDRLKSTMKSLFDAITKYPPDTIKTNMEFLHKHFSVFLKCMQMFMDIFANSKIENSIIDFNDFEHFCLKILKDETLDVASELQDKYIEICVDEYQDCNPVQEAIFFNICQKINGQSSNMFMVGDIKQSIYRFRHANPFIFIDKLDRYHEKDGELTRKIMLTQNFRSRHTVIDTVNAIFSRIMNKDTGDVEYDKNQQLVCGFDYENTGYDYKSELLLIDKKMVNDSSEEDEEDTAIDLEIKVICSKIDSLIKDGFIIYDKAKNKYRPCNYGDFAVLLSVQSTITQTLRDGFSNMGVPILLDADDDMLNRVEIKILLLFLKAINNPINDIALIGLLRSFVFMFSEPDLFKIRAVCKESFYECLLKYANEQDDLAKKCGEFLDCLTYFTERSKTLTVQELLEEIVIKFDYITLINSLPNSFERQEKVRIFLKLVSKYDEGNYKGLFGFLDYVNLMQTSDPMKEKTQNGSADAVRVMTIHKSKGLEFPIVFLAQAGKKFKMSDNKEKVVMHEDLYISSNQVDKVLKTKRTTFSKWIILEKQKKEELSEKVRLLYVALTRAREKLFIVGAVSNVERALNKCEYFKDFGALPYSYIKKSTSFLDMLLPTINSNIANTEIILQHEQVVPQEPKESIKLSITQTDISSDLLKKLEYVYPHKQTLSKISVTGMKKDVAPKTPSQYVFDSGDTQELGTLMHTILNYIDVKNGDIDGCIDMLLNSNFITQDQAKKVDKVAIRKLFDGEIGHIMANATALYRELPFTVIEDASSIFDDPSLAGEHVMIQGKIDCVAIFNDCVYIIDYKYSSKPDDLLIDTYKYQLDQYENVCKKMFGNKKCEKYIYSLKSGNSVKV